MYMFVLDFCVLKSYGHGSHRKAVWCLSALFFLLDPQGCCLVLVGGPPACLKYDAEPHGAGFFLLSQLSVLV